MAKNGLLDVLVVRELDRLSRDVGKLYIVEKELRRYKISIEYVLTDFPQTPAGQLMKNIYASFAQFERDEIRLRMMRGKRNKVNDGSILISNNGPYGYDKYQDGKLIMLKPNPVEVQILKQIFKWYVVDQVAIIEIARRLDSMDAPIPEAYGRKREHGWPPSTIRKMLHNEEYIGEWGYTYDKTEKITVNIPAIIDRDL
jgi:site-specific DNA recombinase